MGAFSYVLPVLALLASILALLLSVQTAIRAKESPEKRLRSAELQIESLSASLQETQTVLETLANRVKMQKVRNAVNHVRGSSGEPDPVVDPEGWRSWKNAQLRNANGRL